MVINLICLHSRLLRGAAVVSQKRWLLLRPTGVPAGLSSLQHRALTNKHIRRPSNKPAPWPYKKRGFPYWAQSWDCRTESRIDESSKWIVVEGNLACGKTEVCKVIADEFDFHNIRKPTMDDVLINRYGSDMRDCYEHLPPRFRFFDVERFHNDPFHINVAQFQIYMYKLKYECGQNAIAHILNTGQGVVLERSVYADHVFADAMYKKGYLSRDFMKYYRAVMDSAETKLVPYPHLIIYLDCPAEKCLENIRKRGIDHEVNGKVIDLEYLQLIEDSYKKKFLKTWQNHSQLLIYDWTEPGDVEQLVEDIEALDMGDEFDYHQGEKFETWYMNEGFGGNLMRREATHKWLNRYLEVPAWRCGELMYHPDERHKWCAALEEHHWKSKYAVGYDPKYEGWWKVLMHRPDNEYTVTGDMWCEHTMTDGYSESHSAFFAVRD